MASGPLRHRHPHLLRAPAPSLRLPALRRRRPPCSPSLAFGLRRRVVVPSGWRSQSPRSSSGRRSITLRTAVVAAPVLPRETTVEVTGWVAEREAAARGGARVRLAVHGIADVAPERTPRAVRITIRAGADDIARRRCDHGARPAPSAERPGDAGRLRFWPRRLLRRDRRGRLRLRRGQARRYRAAAARRSALRKPLADLRETIRRRIIAVLPGDTGEIAAALVMGDQRGISEQTQDAMRASGLGHVLSISGLHMALVAGSTFWLLRALLALSPGLALTRPIKKWAAAGALARRHLLPRHLGRQRRDPALLHHARRDPLAVLIDRRAITLRNVAHRRLPGPALSSPKACSRRASRCRSPRRWRWSPATRRCATAPTAGRASPVLADRGLVGAPRPRGLWPVPDLADRRRSPRRPSPSTTSSARRRCRSSPILRRCRSSAFSLCPPRSSRSS